MPKNYDDFMQTFFAERSDMSAKLLSDFTALVTDYTLYDLQYNAEGDKDRWKFFSRFREEGLTPNYSNLSPALRKKYQAFVQDNNLTSGRNVKRFCLRNQIELGWGLEITKVAPSFQISPESQWYLPRRTDLIIHTYQREMTGQYPIHWVGRGEPPTRTKIAEIRVFEQARTPLSMLLEVAWKEYTANHPEETDMTQDFIKSFLKVVFDIPQIEVSKKGNMWYFEYEVVAQHIFYLRAEDIFSDQAEALNSPLGQHSADDVNSVGSYKFPLGMLRQISDVDFGAIILHLHTQYGLGLNEPFTLKQITTWSKDDKKLRTLIVKPSWKAFLQTNPGMKLTLQDLLNYGRQKDIKGASVKKSKIGEFVLGSDLRIHYDEWTWPYQRFFVNPNQSAHEETTFRNFVFRVDWVSAAAYMGELDLEETQKNLLNHRYHPNSKKGGVLTVGWIRYTVLREQNAVVVDEIQSDLVTELKDGQSLLKGWERFILWHFMMFAKKHLHYEKILMPTSTTRRYAYQSLALPEELAAELYDDLPKALGATQQVTVKFNKQQGKFWVLQ